MPPRFQNQHRHCSVHESALISPSPVLQHERMGGVHPLYVAQRPDPPNLVHHPGKPPRALGGRLSGRDRMMQDAGEMPHNVSLWSKVALRHDLSNACVSIPSWHRLALL